MRISDWSSDVCSSDLSAARSCCTLNVRKLLQPSGRTLADCQTLVTARPRPGSDFIKVAAATNAVPERADAADAGARSEEHTSELQSLMRISSAVFCLKKKKTTKRTQ